MDYKLSIIIPVFNKWNFTKSCLNDLFQLPDDHEIIVVDNGSSDETETETEMRKLSQFNLHYIRNNVNLGFAKACNIGAAHARAPVVMFLNNDIRVSNNHKSWTDNVLSTIEDDVLVGPTGGCVDSKNNFSFLYETKDPNKKINYMSGWCLAANYETWRKLNVPRIDFNHTPQIFSEEFGLAYFEDTDLGFRAKKKNIKFKLIDIPVVHFGKVSSGQLNTSALYSKARQIFINKWGSK